MKSRKLFFDCEVYKDYVYLCFLNDDGHHHSWRFITKPTTNEILEILQLVNINSKNVIITFNGHVYDMLILEGLIAGLDLDRVLSISNDIIQNKLNPFEIREKYNLTQLELFLHIDVKAIADIRASLKTVGARLGSMTIQDLPIEPNSKILEKDYDLLENYCKNDVALLKDIYNHVKKSEVDVRLTLVNETGDKSFMVLGKSKVASKILKQKVGFKHKIDPTCYDNTILKFKPLIAYKFKNETFKHAYKEIINNEYKYINTGKSNTISFNPITVKTNALDLTIGIGGLHSCEKNESYYSDTNFCLIDKDVTSFYPSLIIKGQIIPRMMEFDMGYNLLSEFKQIFNDRIIAKKVGDKAKADVYKIVLNSYYGCFNYRYSCFYDPQAMINVTLNGQLSLLLLIDMLESKGIKVVSSNTDGIVSLVNKSKLNQFEDLCNNWEYLTGLNLEECFYKSIHLRDVNNYIARFEDDSFKTKGVFSKTSLTTNSDSQIITDALKHYILTGEPPEKFINEKSDPIAFINIRGGTLVKYYKGQEIGKNVRFIFSTDGSTISHYNGSRCPNANKVSLVMNLNDVNKINIDYNHYINLTKKLITDLNIKHIY